MKIYYDIETSVDQLKRSRGGLNKANYDFLKSLEEMPVENSVLYPAKLYVFNYNSNSNDLYDTKPFIMSLGMSKKHKGKFFGIDMHWIPFPIRLQIFRYIYDIFAAKIQDGIANFPNDEDTPQQPFIIELGTEFVKKSPFNINIKSCMHSYSLEFISDCRCVNWNKIHYMLISDDDWFKNGTIKDAQEKFIEEMKRK